MMDENGADMHYKTDNEKFYIPYSLSFDQDNIFCAAKMAGHNAKNDVLCRQNGGTTPYNIHTVIEYIYIHIRRCFMDCYIKNGHFTTVEQIPVAGSLSFEQLWDFYHTLFAKRRERKKAAMQKYYKLSDQQRYDCFLHICHKFVFWCVDQKISNEMVVDSYHKQTQVKKALETKYVPFCRTFLDELDPSERKTYDDLQASYDRVKYYSTLSKRNLHKEYTNHVQNAGVDPCAQDVINKLLS